MGKNDCLDAFSRGKKRALSQFLQLQKVSIINGRLSRCHPGYLTLHSIDLFFFYCVRQMSVEDDCPVCCISRGKTHCFPEPFSAQRELDKFSIHENKVSTAFKLGGYHMKPLRTSVAD